MKTKTTLSSLCLLLAAFCISEQLIAQKKFTAIPVDNGSVASLRSHFATYSLFNINTEAITAHAKAQKDGKTDFELELPGLANWKFSIAEHDILAKDYTLTVDGPDGRMTLPRPECMTFAGLLTDKTESRVRLTIDNNTIYGIIRDGDREYFIEPLNYLGKRAASDVFVVYETKDVMPDPGLTCGVVETGQRNNNMQRLLAGLNCVQVQLAIASDESMFIRYGSAAAVQTHNIGVMNNVIWDYVNAQFTDNIEFVIVTQNVSTSAATDQLTPAYTGTNSNTILSNFGAWGQAGNFGTTYDLAQFWTTRNIDNDGAGGGSGTIGLAYRPGMCGPFRYHILEDFTGTNPTGSGSSLRVLTSHEIGHNFNCSHDGAGSGFIMAPSVNNTSTWSAASVTSVDAFVPGLGCLSPGSTAGVPIVNFIGTPEAICVGGNIQLQDRSLRGPTSWNWTTTGGTPSTSTVRNPLVSYATSGIKSISLVASNSGGPGTVFSKSILVSNPPVVACVNSGSIASEGGIRSFSLNTINRSTGSAVVDGNKYLDFSCTDATSLMANTLYSATVNVGFFSATNPSPPHIFNHVLFYIDYNNDGDFLDAGENVYSSGGSAFVGNHNFSFTTPASPVTDQFLRARIIARDFGGSTTSCHDPSAGQVEDYSIFFPSLTLLPVSLISFDGYHHNNNNILNWQIAEAKDHSHFEIERSVTGNSFEYIGRVNGVANSNSTRNYNFTDLLTGVAGQERFYYRLKIVDLDGRYEYSKTITITSKPGNGMLLSLQPNPFGNSIAAVVQLKNTNTVHMQLVDMAGRTIYRESRNLPAGIHTLTYNKFESLLRGAYIIKISTDTETISRLVEKR